jgi:hypothetical protein
VFVYHFSEEPNIPVFVPRAPVSRPEVEPVVWAIDGWHAPMYYFPRDCPRACFWPGSKTSASDRERWYAGVDAHMIVVIESAWVARLRSATVYRYVLPGATFALHDPTAGHYVSRERVVPVRVEPVGDLLSALTSESVELRITPSLIDLWRRVVKSTLEYSGTRIHNARRYDPELFDSP